MNDKLDQYSPDPYEEYSPEPYEVDDLSSDPIYYDSDEGKWYFWNETWSDSHGPFDSRDQASRALVRYATLELGYDDEFSDARDYEGRIDTRSD